MEASNSRHGLKVAIAGLAVVLAVPLPASPSLYANKPSVSPPTAPAQRKQDIMSALRRVADWQIANRERWDLMPQARDSVRNPLDWQQATFWVGLTELADRDPRYTATILDLGKRMHWRLGDRPFHADDQLIAQVWEWASRHGAGKAALSPTIAYFDNVFAHRPTVALKFGEHQPGGVPATCTDRWCWCDAVFMAPPTLLRIGKASGDPRYAHFVDEEFAAARDFLLDPQESLFFRDSRFFDQRDATGNKLFWSRGNGWVLAGLARMLAVMPTDAPNRAADLALFQSTAARVASLQRADGYWSPSMLDIRAPHTPETSGTALFVYALAWGMKAGVLDHGTFAPHVERGWQALVRAIQPDGRIGWVQQVGDRPAHVKADDTQFYGAGAFLLAGTAVYDLADQRRRLPKHN